MARPELRAPPPPRDGWPLACCAHADHRHAQREVPAPALGSGCGSYAWDAAAAGRCLRRPAASWRWAPTPYLRWAEVVVGHGSKIRCQEGAVIARCPERYGPGVHPEIFFFFPRLPARSTARLRDRGPRYVIDFDTPAEWRRDPPAGSPISTCAWPQRVDRLRRCVRRCRYVRTRIGSNTVVTRDVPAKPWWRRARRASYGCSKRRSECSSSRALKNDGSPHDRVERARLYPELSLVGALEDFRRGQHELLAEFRACKRPVDRVARRRSMWPPPTGSQTLSSWQGSSIPPLGEVPPRSRSPRARRARPPASPSARLHPRRRSTRRVPGGVAAVAAAPWPPTGPGPRQGEGRTEAGFHGSPYTRRGPSRR